VNALSLRNEGIDDMGPDEPGATGDDHGHGRILRESSDTVALRSHLFPVRRVGEGADASQGSL
jgi:hypothetical protein